MRFAMVKISTLLCLLVCFVFHACGKQEPVSEEVFVTSISMSGQHIESGTTSQMTATVLPENASDKSLHWTSSDESVATVSQSGLVTALSNGITTIRATAQDRGTVSGSRQIIVSSFTVDPGTGNNNVIEVNNSAQLIEAAESASAGDTIFLKGGIYQMTRRININRSGTEVKPITMMADFLARPLLDFSAIPEGSSNKGIVLAADFWKIIGIDITKAGDNGIQITGSHNIIEYCRFSECADSGLQLDNGASDNLILNCDSYFNADSSIENADGFAVKLNVGSGNKFVGCRAWQNLDDGYDGYLRGADNVTTTYENCWAIYNGLLKDGSKGGGDGNGFKTGGSDDKQLKHNAVFIRCIAAGNVVDGFDHNSNRGEITLLHCAAYNNGRNYSFSNTNPAAKLTIVNSAVLGDPGSTNASATDITNNSWLDGIETTAEDFRSIDIDQLIGTRKYDGSLPDIAFMHLVSGSDLIDKGKDIGLEFNGAAPDLGAFESN